MVLAMNYDQLTKKKKELDAYCPLPSVLFQNLDECSGGLAAWVASFQQVCSEANTLSKQMGATSVLRALC